MRDDLKPTGWKPPEVEQASLLDLFAMAALQGELACQDYHPDIQYYHSDHEQLADRCYCIAQAMMRERAKRMAKATENAAGEAAGG